MTLPSGGSSLFDAYLAATGASRGTQIAPHATAFTKGNYATLVASAPHDACGIFLTFYVTSGRYFYDLAVNSGAEQIVVPDIAVQAISSPSSTPVVIYVPVAIYKGESVRLRGACSAAAQSGAYVTADLEAKAPGGFPGHRMATTYGADLATCTGAAIDAGGTINTEGTAVSFTLTDRALAFGLALIKSANSTAATNVLLRVKRGSNVQFGPHQVRCNNAGQHQPPIFPVRACRWNKDDVIDITAAADTTDAEGRKPHVILYTFA